MGAKKIRKSGNKTVRRLLSREIVVAVARELIINKGHEALSLRHLASHLNVTAAALYAYFDDKLDLLRAVAAGEFDRLIRGYESVEAGEPIERLCKISYFYIDYARSNPELFRAMFLFPPGVDDPELGEPNPVADRSFRTVGRVVKQAIEEGKLRAGDTLLTCVTIWSAVHGVATTVLLGAPVGRKREDLLIHSVVDAMLRGLAEPGSPTSEILDGLDRYDRSNSKQIR